MKGHLTIIKWFSKKKVNMCALDDHGYTPQQRALSNPACAKYLEAFATSKTTDVTGTIESFRLGLRVWI
jgi:hypothetical protein